VTGTPDHPSTASDGPRWHLAAWAAVYLAVAGFLQASLPVPWDADTSYHVAVARLIRRHGVLHAFPWTPFSWLAQHYADKELAFHLLMAPFAGLDWVLCARIVGTLVGAGLLLSSYLILRAERVRMAGVWALLPLIASLIFAFRFLLVRPHTASIALALTILWAAARRRDRTLAVAAALYPWCYVGWYLAIVLTAVAEAAHLLVEGRWRWRSFAVVGVALGCSILLHPNSLNLVRLSWLVNVKILMGTAWAGGSGFELGEEFRQLTPFEWGRYLAPPVVATCASLVAAWRHRHDDPSLVAFSAASVAFGTLTLFTARFAEYFVPFALASMALTARYVKWRHFTAAVAAGLLLYSTSPLVDMLRHVHERDELIPEALARNLQQAIPPGSQVFTCGWLLTGPMMLALPDRKFMVALDPTLFYFEDPALYRLWFRIPREPPPDVVQLIRTSFGARYVMCLREGRFAPFFERLTTSPGVRAIVTTHYWNVYQLD